ncbi:MAG: hypothetical protein AAFO94_18845, partial [Bacteroidota bacterium]
MNASEQDFLVRASFENFQSEYIGPEHCNPRQIEDWIEKTKIIEQLMLHQNRYFLIFSHIDYYPIYFSNNFEDFIGYDLDFLSRQGLWYAFKRLHWSQLSFFLNIHRWATRFKKGNRTNIPLRDHHRYFCGMRFKNGWGDYRSYFLRQKMLMVNDKNQSVLSFVEVEDITAIYKSKHFWSRMVAKNEEQQYARLYLSNGQKKEYNDHCIL